MCQSYSTEVTVLFGLQQTTHTESGCTVAQRLRHTTSASLMHFPLVFKTVSDQADSVSLLDNPGGFSSDPFWLTSADFDNDGDKDIAVAHNHSPQVSVLRNMGNG